MAGSRPARRCGRPARRRRIGAPQRPIDGRSATPSRRARRSGPVADRPELTTRRSSPPKASDRGRHGLGRVHRASTGRPGPPGRRAAPPRPPASRRDDRSGRFSRPRRRASVRSPRRVRRCRRRSGLACRRDRGPWSGRRGRGRRRIDDDLDAARDRTGFEVQPEQIAARGPALLRVASIARVDGDDREKWTGHGEGAAGPLERSVSRPLGSVRVRVTSVTAYPSGVLMPRSDRWLPDENRIVDGHTGCDGPADRRSPPAGSASQPTRIGPGGAGDVEEDGATGGG